MTPARRKLILASASPRRRELLGLLLREFSVIPAAMDETPRPGEPPAAYVSRMAREKAVAVKAVVTGEWVVGADTSVVVDEEILGKPQDPAHAVAMLSALSGRAHRVLSAVALAGPGGVREALNTSVVEFAPLPADWIRAYVDSGEPMDKAGAYAIQGAAAAWVRHLRGSYSGVMGLPLFETAELLRQAGFAAPVLSCGNHPDGTDSGE